MSEWSVRIEIDVETHRYPNLEVQNLIEGSPLMLLQQAHKSGCQCFDIDRCSDV